MNKNDPPSVKSQDWKAILFFGVSTFITCAGLVANYTWHIGSDWGHFSEHLPFLWLSLKQLIIDHNLYGWAYYWNVILSPKSQTHFLIHASVALIPAAFSAVMIGRYFYTPFGRDHLMHISGPQLLVNKSAYKHAKQQLKKELTNKSDLGLNIHKNIAITRTREAGNIFVCGSQGSGKTNFITPLIQQTIQRGERVFIYDEKREFTALFYDPTFCLLIAPWDKRGLEWNISADAMNPEHAHLIAEKLIPDSDDPLWSNGARMILTGMIEILNSSSRPWGWVELAEKLSLDEATLKKELAQSYPRAARFINENNKTTQSFLAQLMGSLGWINTLARAWPKAYKNGISIFRWANNNCSKQSVVIVQADKRYKDIGAPIASTIISLLTSTVIAKSNSTSREMWLFLDEIGNLPKNDSLIEWMSLGRSKGCRIVAGTQSISQIQQLYTDRGADTLLNLFNNFVSMRVGAAGITASHTASIFGTQVVERPSYDRDSHSNWSREDLPVVSASDLVQLPQAGKNGAEGYILIPGWNAVYKLCWPISDLPTKAPEHCPALWLTKEKVPSSDFQTPSKQSNSLLIRRQHADN